MIIKKICYANKGVSLIEIILALVIFSFISASLISLTLSGIEGLRLGTEQSQAEFLAEEGIEAVRALRNRGWGELITTTSTLSLTTSSQVLHWKLNGFLKNTTTVLDSSGNSHHGIVNEGGAVPNAYYEAGGKYHTAFNSSDDYITYEFQPIKSGSFTLSMWVKPHHPIPTGWGGVFTTDTIIRDSFYIETGYRWICENKYSFWLRGDGPGRNIKCFGFFDDTAWHHIAITFDDDTQEMAIYFDGILEHLFLAPGNYTGKFEHLLLGASPSFSNKFQGLIDDVRVFDTVLVDTNIEAVMNDALYGSWELTNNGYSEQFGIFTRSISIKDVCRENNSPPPNAPGIIVVCDSSDPTQAVDPSTRFILSQVTWDGRGGVSNRVSQNAYLTRWTLVEWQQSSWNGGAGQSMWNNANQYDSQDPINSINHNGENLQLFEDISVPGTYPTEGTLYSSAFDMNKPSQPQTILWEEDLSSCSGCDILFQIRTADGFSNLSSAEWSGPEGKDGDDTDWFSTAAGAMIHIDHYSDQWIQYRVQLVGDGTSTPLLDSVTISFE